MPLVFTLSLSFSPQSLFEDDLAETMTVGRNEVPLEKTLGKRDGDFDPNSDG